MGMRTEAILTQVPKLRRGGFLRLAPGPTLRRPQPESPAMQLFLDSTDTAVIKDLAATGLVDGVTTNPSLIAKSSRPMLEVIAEICALVEGPVSAEAVAVHVPAMLAEGRKLAKIAPNVVVKLPLTREGL